VGKLVGNFQVVLVCEVLRLVGCIQPRSRPKGITSISPALTRQRSGYAGWRITN